jgi:Radical SAM superfamily
MGLLEPLRIDEPVERLVSPAFVASPIAQFYRHFFESHTDLSRTLASAALIGISVPMGPQLGPAMILSEVVHARVPDVPIVLGGPTFSLMAEPLIELLLRRFPIGAIVRYDGEMPLLRLVDQRMKGMWEPWTVPGASAIDRSDHPVHVGPATGYALDDLAFAEYDPTVVAMMQDPELAVVQARGCYWGRCAYCDFVELYEGSPRYRTRTAGRFVDELEYQVARHGVRRYAVISEALPPAFARRAATDILDRGLKVEWYSFAMVDKGFTTETFELLAQSGCQQLIIGLESMTDRVLHLVQKAATGVLNREFLTRARDAGVRLTINLIPDLPTTTFAEAAESLREVHDLRDCMTQVSVFPFEATASSRIGRCPSDFGLTIAPQSAGGTLAQFASNHLAAQDRAMSDEERRQIHDSYRAFATEVNIANELAALRVCVDPGLSPDAFVRIVDEILDVLPNDEGVLYYHCLTGDHVRLSHRWHSLVSPSRVGTSRTG